MEFATVAQEKVSDPFWFNDPKILWRRERLQEFFPNKVLSVEEQCNATVRFSAYLTVILYLFTQKGVFLSILPFTLVVTKFGYDVANRDKLALKIAKPLPVTKGTGVDQDCQKVTSLRYKTARNVLLQPRIPVHECLDE